MTDGRASAWKAARRSRERRLLLALNALLLAIVVAISARAAARAVIDGVREERECSAIRRILGNARIADFERMRNDVPPSDASSSALETLQRELEATRFEVLPAREIGRKTNEFLTAQRKLRRVNQDVVAAKRAGQAIARTVAEVLPGTAERIQATLTLCKTDYTAAEDCRALATLPQVSLEQPKTIDEAKARVIDLETLHRAALQLSPRHPRMRALIDADLEQQKRFIALMRNFVAKLDAAARQQADLERVSTELRTESAQLRQQLAGMRVYCKAPMPSPGTKR